MKIPSPVSLLALSFALAAAAFSLAADTTAPKAPPAPVLKSVSCPPECGFMCRSHDEAELIEIVKAHAKSAHGKILTDEQVRSFMQKEGEPAAPRKG